MATLTVQLSVQHRWWLRWYLLGVLVLYRVTGIWPDPDKVSLWIRRGLIVEVR